MQVVRLLVIFFSYFYTLSFHNRWNGLKNRLFLFWIERYFNKIGKRCHFARSVYFRKPEQIKIGNNVNIGQRCRIAVQDSFIDNAEIFIGDNCNIGDDCHFSCANRIVLGENVLIGRKVMINDNSHGTFEKCILEIPPAKRPVSSKGEIKIEDFVWIGENVVILSGVCIGHNSVIAAGAVVTKSIPPFSLAAGVLAKIVKSID